MTSLQTRLLASLLLVVCGAGAGRAWSADNAPPNERRRLELLAQIPLEHQRVAVNQNALQAFLRRAALLYLHRLDSLACRDLFSLGDPATFAGAIGNTDGSDRNLVFINGRGAPQHIDDGEYIFPVDTPATYYPPTADMNTYWHEVNHALLAEAGLGIETAPYGASMDTATDTDDHHPYIEGVGQRGSEAYAELIAFEEAVYKADAIESELLASGEREAYGYAVERQVWADCHLRFSRFIQRMQRVANMPPDALEAYRRATGVFFSPTEEVAEFYRSGGLKRRQHGEVLPLRPPKWVFYPDLPRMPVQIQLQNAQGKVLTTTTAPAGSVKKGIYRNSVRVVVRARGSANRRTRNMRHNLSLVSVVQRGRLQLRLLEDDSMVAIHVRQANASVQGVSGPGGHSVHMTEVDLSKGQPLELVFTHRNVDPLTEPKTYRIEARYTDSGSGVLFDTAATLITFNVTPGSTGKPGAGTKTSSQTGQTAAPREEEKIHVPASVCAGDVFDVSATIPSRVRKTAKSYYWSVGDPKDTITHYRNLLPGDATPAGQRWQLSNEAFLTQFHQNQPLRPRRLVLELTVFKQTQNPMAGVYPGKQYHRSTTFILNPVQLQASVPAADWKLTPPGRMVGVDMRFERMFRKGKGNERSFKTDGYLCIYTDRRTSSAEEIRKEMSASDALKKPPKETTFKLETVKAGPFQTYLVVERPGARLKRARDGGVYFVGSVWGYGAKERFCIKVKGQVSASGKGDEEAAVRRAAETKINELLAAVRSLCLVPVGGNAAGSGTSPVQVQLKPNRAKVPPGHGCEIKATVTGGRTPYTYTWSNARPTRYVRQNTGDPVPCAARFSSLRTASPGSQEVSLLVRDADGKEGRARCIIEIAGPPSTSVGPSIVVQDQTDKPVPPPFTDREVQKNEIAKRPPPPPNRPPPVSKHKPKRPTLFSPPSNAYAVPIPVGWQRLARSKGGDYLFASPDRKYVLACPEQAIQLPVQFKEFRHQLATQILKGTVKGKSELLALGHYSGLRVRTTDRKGRPVWYVYAGSGKKCCLFKVLAASAVAKRPSELERSWANLKGMTAP